MTTVLTSPNKNSGKALRCAYDLRTRELIQEPNGRHFKDYESPSFLAVPTIYRPKGLMRGLSMLLPLEKKIFVALLVSELSSTTSAGTRHCPATQSFAWLKPSQLAGLLSILLLLWSSSMTLERERFSAQSSSTHQLCNLCMISRISV